MRRGALVAAVGLVATLAAGSAGAERPAAELAAKPVPSVDLMVVFRSGTAIEKKLRPKRTRVRVDGKRCAVGARTPLAALRRSRPGRLVLEDFGSCSKRPRDAGGLYVKRLRKDGEVGPAGWVYKVGRKTPGIGAADPTWRLGPRRPVLWFWCRQSGNCQRSLTVRTTVGANGVVSARVTGYDDNGDGAAIEGATVTVGSAQAQTGATGLAQLTLPPGRYSVRAEKAGLVRSFTGAVEVE
jgi:hypothetical protein